MRSPDHVNSYQLIIHSYTYTNVKFNTSLRRSLFGGQLFLISYITHSASAYSSLDTIHIPHLTDTLYSFLENYTGQIFWANIFLFFMEMFRKFSNHVGVFFISCGKFKLQTKYCSQKSISNFFINCTILLLQC